MTDPISNMLTSIRNAQAVHKDTVSIPFSTLKYKIATTLEKEKFIEKVEKVGRKAKKIIKITLKYEQEIPFTAKVHQKKPTISSIKRISKPGQRIYLPFENLKKVKAGYGIAIISTSKGIMTDKEARKKKLGGEMICEIW